MKKIKFLWCIPLLSLWLTACGGPSVCDCDRESIKEDPDEEVLQKCRKKLGSMEIKDVLKELEQCS
ncbi:MAG TPA: hypothetical protein ENJ82_06790 [Bacteroidetes bacterium]|nr:hypothetical protein [Bacteroidota bacterium]